MTVPAPDLEVEMTSTLAPRLAFDRVIEDLGDVLERHGIELEVGPTGRVRENADEVGRVRTWEPGRRVVIDWSPTPWNPDTRTEVDLHVRPFGPGSEIHLEIRGWKRAVGEGEGDLEGWFAQQILAPLLTAAAPRAFGDWIIDRHARRPSATWAERSYRDPLYHRPNFLAIFDVLDLHRDDVLLEVGCGGGAFLADALRTGCRAMAADHSPAMVRLARESNREAMAEHRVEIVRASAEGLPFPSGSCTRAVMTGVVQFFDDPTPAFREVARVLSDGGLFVAFSGTAQLRGTPAAPEPAASRLRFFDSDELIAYAHSAGFAKAQVDQPDMRPYARKVGVPEESLELFGPGGGQLLRAWKRGTSAPEPATGRAPETHP